MSFTFRIATLTLMLAASQHAFADDNGNWNNLKSLNPGDTIGVIQSNQKRIEGRFQQATESSITLRTDHEVTLSTSDVVRVYRRAGMRRTTKALIGAAAGIAAGGILYGTAGERFRNEGQDVSAGLWIAGGAGIGAGIGALMGGNYHTVYQRSPAH